MDERGNTTQREQAAAFVKTIQFVDTRDAKGKVQRQPISKWQLHDRFPEISVGTAQRIINKERVEQGVATWHDFPSQAPTSWKREQGLIEPKEPKSSDIQAERTHWAGVVEEIAPALRAGADENERLRRLSPPVVEALREAGVMTIASPCEVGGANLHPVTQMEVFAALTRNDTAAGWCAMISAQETAWLGSRLPEDALDDVFGGVWPVTAGAVTPAGAATSEEGGWRFEGRWGWGSGIDHADWVIANAPLVDDSAAEGQPQLVVAALPVAEVEIEDTWRPLGMRGTGSTHYRITGKFVPAERRLTPFELPVLRGDGWLLQPTITFLCAGAIAMPLGLAERALEEAEQIAASRIRVGQRSPLADREVFQRGIGAAAAEVAAVRGYGEQLLAELNELPPPADVAAAVERDVRARAVAAWAQEVAERTARFAHLAAGGDAVLEGHPLERLVRDAQTMSAHVVVSEAAYIRLGQQRLGLPVRPGL